MPLVNIRREGQKPVLVGGILKELGAALFTELNIEPDTILVPKVRVAPSLIAGKISILCHLNEVWQQGIKDEVYWTIDLYESVNYIVFTKSKPIKKMSDIYGQRLGTVLNFIYQNFEEEFERKKVLREDGPNNESNIRKLLKGRIDYILMSNLEYAYYHKTYSELQFVNLGLDAVMTKCALSKNTRLNLEDVNKALEKIKRSGKLDGILKKYR
ncbi:Bacterial extracellular solute-binding protein, family 3 [compost metagenome]